MSIVAEEAESFKIAYRFSNHFGINRKQSQLDFVDVFMDTDIKLYVDPYALSVQLDEWSSDCTNLVVDFFQELISAIKSKNGARIDALLNNLHEPNETRLGESIGFPKGRGIGTKQAEKLRFAFANSKAVQTGLLQDLSDCELFIDGISNDKISDITTNIVRTKLTQYTKQQCDLWGVPTESVPAGPSWDVKVKNWVNYYAPLPIYKGYPIILVPKRSVRYKMTIDSEDFYNKEIIERIRQDYLVAEQVSPGTSLVGLLKAGYKPTKKETKESFPKTKSFLQRVSEIFPDILEGYKLDAKLAALSGKYKPDDPGLLELLLTTAHDRKQKLAEEINVNINLGENSGSMGNNNTNRFFNLNVYLDKVEKSINIAPDTKELLKQVAQQVDTSNLEPENKEDAKENLSKLTDELADQQRPGMVARYIMRLAQVMPAAVTILQKSEQVVELLKQVPDWLSGNPTSS